MQLDDFLEEAAIMKEMKHPNLVRLLGTFGAQWTGFDRSIDSRLGSCITQDVSWDLKAVPFHAKRTRPEMAVVTLMLSFDHLIHWSTMCG